MATQTVLDLNAELYRFIQAKDYANPRVKEILKAQKVSAWLMQLNIYTVANMNSQPSDFLAAARTVPS